MGLFLCFSKYASTSAVSQGEDSLRQTANTVHQLLAHEGQEVSVSKHMLKPLYP